MAKTAFYFSIFLLFCFASFGWTSLHAQTTSQTSFGKNRVQYHRQFDDWMLYETANFVTYWYGDARNVAQSALQTAELDYPEVQQLLEHQMSEKIEMLVFSDITDLKQSNIGEDQVLQLRVGETKVVGNKVFCFFDGNHQHLRAQIREGMAGVMINSMLFGSNLQEIVQNAVLLNLPGWYVNGLSAYCGQEWSTELDNQLRDLLATNRYKNFDKLAKTYPRLAGHAFWNYISLHFGRGTVSNLLYLTRINRSMDAGFLYVLGNGYHRTTETMLDYYRKGYREEAKVTRLPDDTGLVKVKNKRNLPLSQLKISPDGKRIAWVSNDIGRWRVWVLDIATGKRKKLMRGGSRNALQATDYGYPQLSWNPDNQRLAVLYEQRDVPKLAVWEVEKHKKEMKELSPEFQRVYSMDYVNPSDLVFSAMVKGYSDLFVYRTVTRQTERLTQDFWDDLDAKVVTLDGRRGLLFSSNRTDDTLSPQRLDTILPLGHFDLFYYDFDNRGKELIRITNTPLADERVPVGIDSNHFAYLSDESGIVNRQTGYMEPYLAFNQAVVYLKDGSEVKALDLKNPGDWPAERALYYFAPLDTVLKNVDSTQIDSIRFSPVFKKRPRTWNLTNYDRNIFEQHTTLRTGQLAESVQRGGKTLFYIRKTSTSSPESPNSELRTSNSELQPSNSELRTSNFKLQTSNFKLQTPVRITRYRERTLREAGLPIPPQPNIEESVPANTGVLPDKSSAMVVAEPQPGIRDSAREIEPGWMFQVPDYLTASPVPSAPAPRRVVEIDFNEQPKESTLHADSLLPMPKRTIKAQKPIEFGKNNSIVRFIPPQIIPYRLKFRTDYISTTMDNNLLFEGLESYAGSPQGFGTPPLGILLKANFKDMLEDYIVEAGFRLPTTFNGAEYYLWFANKKRRLDRRISLYRKTVTNGIGPFQYRTNTVLGQYELSYPLDAFFSLRAVGTLRQDKQIPLSTDSISLDAPPRSEQRAALRLSAVYDNTVDVDLNIKTGTRAKISVEAVKRVAFNTDPSWNLRFNKGFMTVVSLDARHYQRLDRRSIFATRLAAATTFGSERVLYYLGGVDNWIFPKFNNSIQVPQNGNFAFEALATNLRGFQQNIRNGNSYVLWNNELRIPIFKYLSKKPVLGNFWRNFQVVGFFDIGTAWQGQSPYSGDNPLNTEVITDGPDNGSPIVIVKVNYFRDPLVAGYGVGLRTVLFGMYLRADYGWGIETKVVQKPVMHIALGTDF